MEQKIIILNEIAQVQKYQHFLHVSVQFKQHHMLKILTFLQYIFCQKSGCCRSVDPQLLSTIFMSVSCCFYCHSSIVYLEVLDGNTCNDFVIVNSCLGHHKLFPY